MPPRCKPLARAVCDKKISFDNILDSQDFLLRLREIPGIGAWTAQYIAMRALGEPDAFPVGDIALVRALELADARQLEARAEVWRPWRAYAAMYLWSGSGRKEVRTGRAQPPAKKRRSRAQKELVLG